MAPTKKRTVRATKTANHDIVDKQDTSNDNGSPDPYRQDDTRNQLSVNAADARNATTTTSAKALEETGATGLDSVAGAEA